MSFIRLATRKSRLALFNPIWCGKRFKLLTQQLRLELVEVTTTGDQREIGLWKSKVGTGLFTKELESLLLDGKADIAVHSSKDLPAKLVDGLAIAGYLPREQVEDVLHSSI